MKPTNAGYQNEAASRGLSCGGLVKDVSAPNIERFTKDQPDVNDDYQVHYIYFLASDTPDKRLDVNGWIEKLALKANANFLYWSALSPNSNGVGQQFKLDMRKDGKLDISFLRAPVTARAMDSSEGPAEYIFDYIRKAGFNNSKKVYAIFAGSNAMEGNGKGGEAGVALMVVFIPAAKSYSKAERETLVLHELIHSQGVAFSCGKRDIGVEGHVRGRDVMGDSNKPYIDQRNDTYYRHNIQSCPDLSKSVYLTPTGDDPWDP
jgi:hypothetical protein